MWNCLRQGCSQPSLGASAVYPSASVCSRWVIFNSIGFGAAGQKKTFRVTRQRCSRNASRFSDSVCGKANENCARVGKSEVAVSRVFLAVRHENDISMQERTVGWEEDRYFRVIFKIIAIFLAVAAAPWPYDSRVTLVAVQLFKKSCKIVPLQYRASARGELKFSATSFRG